MANKKQSKLDDFNLDDFDYGFNIADNPRPNKKDRNPVVDVAVNGMKGFKATVANRGFLERVLRKVLPKGYSDAYDEAKKVVVKGRGLYNGVAQDVRPAWNDLQRATREISPIVRQKGNNTLADRLDKLAGKAPTTTSQAQYDPDEDNISRSMAEIAKLTAEDSAVKDQRARAENQIKDRTETRRYSAMFDQQSIVADGVNELVGYTKHITNRYQQKMLELNYRQYYAQRDTLGVLQGYAKDTSTQLETIIKNTALPDIIKMQASEQFVNQARQRMFGKVQNKVGDYFKNYTDQVFDNIGKIVNDAKNNLVMGMQAGSSLIDAQRMGMEYDDGSEGEGAGALAGKGLGYGLGNYLGKHLKKVVSKNKTINDIGAKAGYYANNIPEGLNELRGNRRFYGDWRDTAMAGVRQILPGQFQRNTLLERPDDSFGGGATTFDNQTHKTINEILPGYLARILQSLETSRTGTDAPRLVYNQERNAFTSQKTRAGDVANAVMSKSTVENANRSAESMIDRIDPDKKLSPEARSALRETLIREADKGNSYSPSKLANGEVDFSSDPRLHTELTSHFKSRYGVDGAGKVGKDAEFYHRASLDNSSFKSLRDTMPDVYATIHRMVATGNTEDLRALGILVRDPKDPTKETINYQFIQDQFEGRDWNLTDKFGPGGGRGRVGPKPPSPAGGGNPPPVPPRSGPGPTPFGGGQPPTGGNQNHDALITSMASGTDKLMESITKAMGGLGEKFTSEVDKVIASIVENSAKPPSEEALIWLKRITNGIYLKGKGKRKPKPAADPNADADFENEEDDEDWDDMDGDFFDRTRGRVRRSKSWLKRNVPKGARYARGKLMGGVRSLKDFTGRQFNRGVRLATLAPRVAYGAAQRLWNMTQEVFDIYTKPGEPPVMTAVKMRNGQYRDFYSQAVIKKFSDIKGPVIDETGNVVLTEEDIRNGLYGANGKPVGNSLMRGVVSGMIGLAGKLLNVPGSAIKLAMKVSKGAVKFARNLIDGPEDVYVKGEESPRLLAVIMRRNGYRSKATGAIIQRPSDIDGEVLDLQGNTVLSADDIRTGLVDSKGRNVVGLGGKLLRMAKGGFGLVTKASGMALRAANKVRKYAWDKTKALGRFGGRAAKGIWGALSKGIHFQANIGLGMGVGGASGVEPIVGGLEAIYNLLDDRLPGTSKLRKGSWQEQMSKRDTPKQSMEKIKKVAESNPLLKYLMMFGGAVMTGFAWLKSKLGGFVDFFLKNKGAAAAADIAGDALDGASDLPGGRRGKKSLLRRAGGALWKGTKAVGKGALALLPFAGSALSAVGTAVAGVGSAIATVVSAPVLLAVGAVAAVAAAGYFTYKYFKGRPQALQRLRLAEYGFAPDDKDALKRILEIEGYLLPNVTTSGGQAQLTKYDAEEVLKRAGIDNDPDRQRNFSNWFALRFRPVFLRNAGTLAAMSSGTNLLEVDDKLDKSKVLDFANATKFNQNDATYPYRYGGKPFVDLDELSTGTKAIDDELKAISDEFGKYRKSDATTTDGKSTSPSGIAAKVPGMTAPDAGSTAPPATPGKFQKSDNTYVTPSETTGGYEPGITVKDWKPATNRLLDDLTAIRMRLYGLTLLDVSQVNALTTLETNVQDYLNVDLKGTVTLARSAEALYQDNAGLFGRNPTDPKGQSEWLVWFNARFLPVYSQFVSALYAIDKSMKPGLAWKYLKIADALSIAELLKGVRSPSDYGGASVWSVKAGPFAGMESNGDISTIDANLTSMRAQIKDDKYQEKTPNAAAMNKNGNGDGTTSSNQSGGTNNAGSDAKGGMWNKIKSWFTPDSSSQSQANSSNPYAGNAPSYIPGYGMTTANQPGGPSGMAGPMGSPIDQPGNGTGGDINQIPQPKGDGSWEALRDTIVAAAKMAGVDPGLMASMAYVESNFRASVKPGTSAAQGLYQFIPSTWKSMLSKYGAKYGINPATSPSDPRANALMGAEYLKENQKILENKLGRPVTGTDLYLTHFLGGGGGTRMLKAPSGDLAQNHAEASAVKANSTIFFAGSRPKTVQEIISWANKRIETDGGKYASDAKSFAASGGGKPVAANDASNQSPDAANDASGTSTPATPTSTSGSSADGSAAYAATQAMAQEYNAAPNSSTGLPSSAPAPGAPGMGTSTNTAPAPVVDSAPSASSTAGMVAASQKADQDAGSYAAETNVNSQTSKRNAQYVEADNAIEIQQQQLETQQDMAATLLRLEKILGSGSFGSAAGAQPPSAASNPAAATKVQNTTQGAQDVKVPVSMKRKAG